MGVLQKFNIIEGFRFVRFIVLAAASLYLAFVQASVLAFNVAYVEMADRSTSPLLGDYVDLMLNQTVAWSMDSAEPTTVDFDWAPADIDLGQRRYTFSAVHKSLAFAGSFAGSLFGTFPLLWLLRRAGARKTMFVIGIGCALLCGLTPIAISVSFWLFVALRFASGFFTAPLLPLMGAIVEDWAAMEEKGLFISCLSGSIEIAMLFTLPVGALIAENISWPATFYIHALICAFFTIILIVVYRDDPIKHPLLSAEEVKLIKKGKNGATVESPSARAVLSSTAVWAVFVAAMGTYFVSQFMAVFSPQYFTSVLGYSTTIAGTLTIIPTVGLLPVKFITGLVSDRLIVMSEASLPTAGKLRFFNSLSSFGAATVLIAAVFVRPSVNDAAATALIIVPFIFLGFASGGFQKAAVMIAREHAPFVFSLMHIFDVLALLAVTFLVPLFTPDNTFDQWKIVLIIFAVVLIVSNVFFTIFVKAEPENWATSKVNTSQHF